MARSSNNLVSRSRVNRQILAACDFTMNGSDKLWIEELKTNRPSKNISPLAAAPLSGDEHTVQQSMINSIDKIMEALCSYTLLFNQDVDNEHYLTVTGPALVAD